MKRFTVGADVNSQLIQPGRVVTRWRRIRNIVHYWPPVRRPGGRVHFMTMWKRGNRVFCFKGVPREQQNNLLLGVGNMHCAGC